MVAELLLAAVLAASPAAADGAKVGSDFGAIADDFGAVAEDAILDALWPELARSMTLKLPGQPAPYYVSFSHLEQATLDLTARLGETVRDDFSLPRYIHVRMRVGSTELDNTNFLGGGWPGSGTLRVVSDPGGTVPGGTVPGGTVPGEENGKPDLAPIIRDAWQAADAAYKRSVESLAAKAAALKRERKEGRAPDFSPAEPVRSFQPAASLSDGDRTALRTLAEKLSAVFSSFPGIQRAEVRIHARSRTRRMLDTEGFASRQSYTAFMVTFYAEAQTDEGTPFRDVLSLMAPTAGTLPPYSELERRIREFAARVERRTKAQDLPDPYLGPVLFSPEASAEFVKQTLAGDLAGTPSPVTSDDYMKSAVKGGQLAKFLGLRILPEWTDLVSDPGRTELEGRPLLGSYVVDCEGVRGKAVDLVRAGRLSAFLMSRTPSEKFGASNGHGRIVAGSMVKAGPANLILTARKTAPERGLVKELLRLARKEGLPYALIVRHLNEPSVGEGAPRRISLGTGGEDAEDAPSRWAISPAFDVVRISTETGEEEPLRGVLFGPIGIAELRSITAATRETAVYSYVVNPDSSDYNQGYTDDAVASIASPGLLFPQLEVRPAAKKRRPLPVLANPFFAGRP